MGTILVPLFAHYRPAARLVQAAHAEGLRLGYLPRLIFGYSSENMNGEAVRARHVHRNEVNATFNQARDKRHASRQEIEAGNDKPRPVYSAQPAVPWPDGG